jgi:hypothetical protein
MRFSNEEWRKFMEAIQQRSCSTRHKLKTIIFLLLLVFMFLPVTALSADDAKTQVEQLFNRYFVYFNLGESELIAKHIIGPPVQLLGLDSHEVWATQSEISSGFEQAIRQLRSVGWSKSLINNLDVCIVADNLAFVDLNYSREDASGELIPPAERRGLYVVLKSDLGWRIIADYGHDTDKRFSCSI